jgi:hypothetical protein
MPNLSNNTIQLRDINTNLEDYTVSARGSVEESATLPQNQPLIEAPVFNFFEEEGERKSPPELKIYERDEMNKNILHIGGCFSKILNGVKTLPPQHPTTAAIPLKTKQEDNMTYPDTPLTKLDRAIGSKFPIQVATNLTVETEYSYFEKEKKVAMRFKSKFELTDQDKNTLRALIFDIFGHDTHIVVSAGEGRRLWKSLEKELLNTHRQVEIDA